MEKKIASFDDLFSLFYDCKGYSAPIFRGHSNKNYPIQSSAVRRLINSFKVNPTNKAIIEYHAEELLENAKNMHYNYHENGQILSDIELLAKLQHQGAATSLLDFTKNLSVSLWFACKNEHNDGAVFVIDDETDVTLFRRATRDILSNNSIWDIFKETEKLLYIWEPPGLKTRILQQDSVFVFGLCENILNEKAKKIIIEAGFKKDILEMLEKVFNIGLNTLFKDFDGFANASSQNETLVTTKSKKLYLQGNEYFQEKKFIKALECYERSIDIDPSSYELLFKMVDICILIKDIPKAINFCERIFKYYPEDQKIIYKLKHLHTIQENLNKNSISKKPLYFVNIGKCYTNLDFHDNAIEYFDEALKIDELNSEAHFRLGIAFLKIKDYKKAIEFFKKSIKIQPNNINTWNSLYYAYYDAADITLDDLWKNIAIKIHFDIKSAKKGYFQDEISNFLNSEL